MDGLVTDSVSTVLRQAREQRGVSLPDAARAANVPLSYLQALEAGGDYRLLVDPMYLIPFLRTYAVYLGLNPDDTVGQFVAELQKTTVSPVRTPLNEPLSPLRPARLSAWTVPLVVLVGGLVGVGLIVQSIVPSAWRAEEEEPAGSSVVAEAVPADPAPSGERPPISEQQPRVEISQTPEPAPLSAPLASEPPEPAPLSAPLASEPPEPAVQTAGLHQLHVRALETTWLHVMIDDGLPQEVLLQPGEQLRWEANRHFILTVGNAGGVEISFDDEPFRRLGGSGEVVRELRLPAREVQEPQSEDGRFS